MTRNQTLEQIMKGLERDTLQALSDIESLIEEEKETAKKEGYKEGYEKGDEDGYNKGFDAGKEEGIHDAEERFKAKEKVKFT
jgi:flagellar assembly protein FliH